MTDDTVIRDARIDDAPAIARLFRISSDGVADYIWRKMAEDQPEFTGLGPLQVGARRYARENTEFSYQNCLVAERADAIVGMLHAYAMHPDPDADAADRAADEIGDIDPVLVPYAVLERVPSLYVSGIALLAEQRGRGLGSRLLGRAFQRARDEALGEVSLIAFEQNTEAVRLYERFGFAVADRHPVVPHPLIHVTGDALLMVCPADRSCAPDTAA